MSVPQLTVAIFVFSGVAIELTCCAGLLMSSHAYDRLHFLGPATVLGPGLITIAVIVHGSSAASIIKSILVTLSLLFVSPILTHATAKAIHARELQPDKAAVND